MSDVTHFLAEASSGRLNRRQVLERGLALGVATTTLTGLVANAPEATAAPRIGRAPFSISTQDDDPGTVTVCFVDGASDIDPHSSYTTYGAVVAFASYDMLINYKGLSTSEYEPMLAESWEISDDLTTYTFKIRANATFHDGTPCDAQMVKDSMVRLVRMEMGPYLVLERFCKDPENEITVVDATTLTFTLPKPEPLFMAAMASSYGPFAINMKRVEENKTDEDPWAHEWFLTNADGTGPYKLVRNDFKEGMEFERHEGYWGTFPEGGFNRIVIRVVPENATRRQLAENGELDLMTNDLTQEDYEALRSVPTLQVLTYPTTRVDWFILNWVTLPLEARQGLCWAFPYEEVVQGVYKGTVKRTGPIPDNIQGYDPEAFVFTTDLEQARTLLTAGGYGEGSTISMSIEAESERSRTMAELFQANLAQIGVTLDIQVVDTTTQEDIVYGDAPAEEKPDIIGLWAWWPDYNDGWNQLAPNFLIEAAGGGGSNAGYYDNSSVADMMAQAEVSTSLEELDSLMKQIQQILIHDDPAAIFVGQVLYTTVADATIQGIEINPIYIEQYMFHRYYRSQG